MKNASVWIKCTLATAFAAITVVGCNNANETDVPKAPTTGSAPPYANANPDASPAAQAPAPGSGGRPQAAASPAAR